MNYFSKRKQSRSAAALRRCRPWLETLEDRTLLAGLAPASIDPNLATQSLFGSALFQEPLPAGPSTRLIQFAVNGQGAQEPATFDLTPANSGSATPAALGLYDADGNLLAAADQGSAVESLTVQLQSQRVYELGVFFPSAGSPDAFSLTVTPGPQLTHGPLTVDPSTGTVAGAGSFDAPTDVDYYPLDLTNAGLTGTVTVTPTGLDVQPFAALFRRDTPQDPWLQIAQGTQAGAVTLDLTPPTGQDLTDAAYLLGVAPQGFHTAAGAYQIDVATTTLAQATVDPAQATDLLTPAPISLGVAQVQQNGPINGTPPLFLFRAPGSGTATITLTASADQSVLSVYDATSMDLLPDQVASSTDGGQVTLSVPVSAGHQYVVRASTHGAPGGGYHLTISTPYQATPLAFNPDNTTGPTTVLVGPATGAQFYRLTIAPQTDVLAVQVTGVSTGDPVAVQVVVVGPYGVEATSAPVAPGATVFLPVVLTGISGPYDVFVEGTSGNDLVTLRVGQLQVARQMSLSQLMPSELDLTGNLTAAIPDSGQFGQVAGLEFYQLLVADVTQPTTVTVQRSSGNLPLLAHYQEEGGLFQLAGFQLPDAQGQMQAVFHDDQLHGVAAYSLDLGGSQSPYQLSVKAPPPVAEQLGMVPDVTQPGIFQSIMDTHSITLQQGFQQQLWQTILPQDLTAGEQPGGLRAPTIIFHPLSSTGPVHARVTVSVVGHPDINAVIQPVDPNHPWDLTFLLPNTQAVIAELQGATVQFRVEGLGAALLGSGVYDLSIHVATSDPVPFQLDEKAWQFSGPTPAWLQEDAPSTSTNPVSHLNDPGTLPAGIQVVDVPQNQFGHGEVMGNFTSSTAGDLNTPDPGSIAVYRFWALNPGAVSVKTVAAPGSTVNTDLHVYRATYVPTAPTAQQPNPPPDGILYLGSIQTVGTNSLGADLDWYAADRSQIDAETFINNVDYLKYTQTGTDPYGTGGGMYFVVVRNQEGSQGQYILEVDTAPMPLQGTSANLVTAIPSQGGTVQLNLASTSKFLVPNADPGNQVTQDALAYFPVQIPNYHNSAVTVSADELFPSGTLWEIEAIDAVGNSLRRISSGRQGSGNTEDVFDVPAGMQTIYLRVLEKVATALNANVTVSTTVTPPWRHPAAVLPPATHTVLLPTDPFGNAGQNGSHDGPAARFLEVGPAPPRPMSSRRRREQSRSTSRRTRPTTCNCAGACM